MMQTSEVLRDRRRAARLTLPVLPRIEYRDGVDIRWREIPKLISVSKIGIGFYSTRRMNVGRLIHVTAPLPPAMRFYAFDEPQYSIWGIIRHCHPRTVTDDSLFHIGVAFIGSTPPAAFRENPLRDFKIVETEPDPLFAVTEADEMSRRIEPRYNIPFEVFAAKLDETNQNMVRGETTVSENISKSGAAIFSALDVEIGSYIKIVCEKYRYTSLAVVRNRRVGKDNLPRLHVEFVEKKFPLEDIVG